MIRILLLLVPVIAIYLAIRWFQKTPAEEAGRRIKKTGWIVAILLLLVLAGSGKLNVLFAALGVAIAFMVRLMPVILQYAPQLHRLWQNLNNGNAQENRQYKRRPARGGISKDEALEILGLKSGASQKDIIEAHRKLISKLHPDRGGSDYLAAQINLAKKILLANSE
ncbi:MAG: DnaJ domain-containing protein [Methylomonas sp.]|nr:DnaJ domain-containing protein [Methylomonas sp.]